MRLVPLTRIRWIAGLALVVTAAIAGGGISSVATRTPPAPSRSPIVRFHRGTSANWAGYAASGSPGSFTSVSASWIQPTVRCGSTNTYSSFWVGLDGANDSTVEQLGTEADCIAGRPVYFGWWEMFPGRAHFTNMAVVPSHLYRAVVASLGAGRFALVINDATTGQSFSTIRKLKRALGASAEVIAEAPSAANGVLALADFASVSFADALGNGVPLGTFANLEPITGVNPAGMKATPSSFDATRQQFSVTWSPS